MTTSDEKKWRRFLPLLFLVFVFPLPEAIVWLLTGTNPLSAYFAVYGVEYVFVLILVGLIPLIGIIWYIRLRFS